MYSINLLYRHEEINNEKFMMFVIQTLGPFQHASFELFIDFTHTSTESRFRLDGIVMNLPYLNYTE